MNTKTPIRILVVGCGNMGISHATAYHNFPEFDICGLVSRGDSKSKLNKQLQADYPLFTDFDEALSQTKPDAVCISTYPDSHEDFALKCLEAGCHVFIEKPLADSIAGCERIIAKAKKVNKKVVVGYILRHHPSWIRFIEEAEKLGKPLVMRMNLNQQSQGYMWDVHRDDKIKTYFSFCDRGTTYQRYIRRQLQLRPAPDSLRRWICRLV